MNAHKKERLLIAEKKLMRMDPTPVRIQPNPSIQSPAGPCYVQQLPQYVAAGHHRPGVVMPPLYFYPVIPQFHYLPPSYHVQPASQIVLTPMGAHGEGAEGACAPPTIAQQGGPRKTPGIPLHYYTQASVPTSAAEHPSPQPQPQPVDGGNPPAPDGGVPAPAAPAAPPPADMVVGAPPGFMGRPPLMQPPPRFHEDRPPPMMSPEDFWASGED